MTDPSSPDRTEPTPAADQLPERGRSILRGLAIATAVFTLSCIAAVLWPGPIRVAAVVVDLVLFVGGSLLFLAAFGVAVSRSRTEEVTMAGAFFLSGTAPPRVRKAFFGLLAVQVVVSLVAASMRPYTAVAFAVLAPMSAFGAMAWWGARHGVVPTSADQGEQG